MQPSSVGRDRFLRGFTLIEMMIVVALIGIVSALALPNLRKRMKDSEANVEVVAVRDALIRLRNLSRTHSACVAVTVAGNALVGTPYLQCDPLADPQPPVSIDIDPDLVTLGALGGVNHAADGVSTQRRAQPQRDGHLLRNP